MGFVDVMGFGGQLTTWARFSLEEGEDLFILGHAYQGESTTPGMDSPGTNSVTLGATVSESSASSSPQ